MIDDYDYDWLYVAPGRKGKEGLPRSKEFEVENTEGMIEPGKRKALKHRKITITGLGIPPVSYTDKGLPQCNAATIKALAGKIDGEDVDKSRWGLAYEVRQWVNECMVNDDDEWW